jgi:hypothetical protein
MPYDHDIRIWVDAAMYTALHHMAREDDRALSEYIRRVLREHIRQVSAQLKDAASPAAGLERDR